MTRLELIKAGIRRSLPVLQMIAAVTPTKADDMVVGLLAAVLSAQEPADVIEAIHNLVAERA